MKHRAILSGALLASAAMLSSVVPGSAWPQFTDLRATGDTMIVPVQMGGGGMGGGGMGGGGMDGGGMGGGGMGGMGAAGTGGMGTTNVNRTNVNRTNVNRTNINRTNVNVNRGVYVSGSVRPWVRQPYYGTIIGGVALGTLIAATAVPVAPAPNLCWIWSSPAQSQGYWDYCTPP
jgi:hypothetical protein